jgi:carbon-monoxide dehydrogenase medium subunit
VIPTAFDYQRASSIDDALAKLTAPGGEGKLLAGGHSLVPLMKLRLSEPKLLIDIARIPGLSGIREKNGRIEIGAGTTHAEVASSALLREKCPMVADTAAEIGDPQVRNRGTLGGSLAHADPSADYPAAMLAVDAEIHVKGPKGWRAVKAADFFQDLFTVNLARTRSSRACSLRLSRPPLTRSFTSARRTSRSSASPRRSRSLRARSGPPASG